MTKLKLITCLFILIGSTPFLHAQELTFTSELPEVRASFVGSSGNQMIYSASNQNMTAVINLEYFIVNTANPSEKRVKVKPDISFSKGKPIFKMLEVEGDYIYEFFEMNTYPYKLEGVAIIKREIETLKQVGIVELLGEDFKFAKTDDEGFYFLSKNILYRYDSDLKQLWSKKYEMFDDINVKLSTIEIDDNLNVLMSVSVTENTEVKMFGYTPPAKSSLIFVITDLIGEVKVIAPEIPKDMYVKKAGFKYNEITKELTGFFIVNSYGIGYVFVRWDINGSIITTGSHDFKFSEFLDDNLKKYAELYKFKPDKYDFKSIYGTSSIHYLENGNILYVLNYMYGFLSELTNSRLIFMVSPKGELLWNKMIPYSGNDIYVNGDSYIHDNKLHFLISEFNKLYESGNYEIKEYNPPANGKTVLLAQRVIDLNNGAEISNKPLIANPSDRFMPSRVIYNQSDKVIVKYSNTKKNLEQFLTIEF